jgi:cyclic beta-1,2-glucan synthetase
VGAHGLPLMGTGDWNDGMNRVGHGGRGESVWLGFFLCKLVADFAPVATARGDTERALRWQAAAVGWRAALRGAAWDGEWFTRAFFDDGSPLGSQRNTECRIDLIAQAWAVLSGVATPAQQQQAMASAERLLMDEAAGLVRLLDPPLVHAQPSAGYIQAYPPGVRENGGQYNHAGVWALMAQVALGQGDAAWETFQRLSPAHRAANPQRGPAYALEPYAMAADVYTHPPYVGRGGWSWYTGSAGWLHRAAVESIIGLRQRGGSVCFTPCLPSHWPMVSLRLRRDGRVHEFTLCAADAADPIAQARADGAVDLAAGAWLQLALAGTASRHLVVMPRPVAVPMPAVAPAPPVVPMPI